MTPEGTQGVQQFHAALAESSQLAARSLRELARAFEQAASAHEAFRGRLAAQELADTVLPEAARGRQADSALVAQHSPPRQDARPLPNYMQPAAPPLEAVVPWITFWKDLGITSIEAVKMIRSELPTALGPTEAEAATWPTDPDAEAVAAAAKLTSLPPPQAVAAQDMLLRLWRKRKAAR
jgi:hypothetical protein